MLGLGNLVMQDDALGVRVVEELTKRYCFPEEVKVLDGGTLGLDLLPRIEGIDKLLVIDAVQMGANITNPEALSALGLAKVSAAGSTTANTAKAIKPNGNFALSFL